MKRMHVHLAVADIDASVQFYRAVFGAGPTVLKADYAKWQLDNPRVNFAISHRGNKPGVDHFGIQVDHDEERQAVAKRLRAAGEVVVAEEGAQCCYAQSDKHWVMDPQGLPWEVFHSLGEIPVFGAAPTAPGAQACCGPAVTPAVPAVRRTGCC